MKTLRFRANELGRPGVSRQLAQPFNYALIVNQKTTVNAPPLIVFDLSNIAPIVHINNSPPRHGKMMLGPDTFSVILVFTDADMTADEFATLHDTLIHVGVEVNSYETNE